MEGISSAIQNGFRQTFGNGGEAKQVAIFLAFPFEIYSDTLCELLKCILGWAEMTMKEYTEHAKKLGMHNILLSITALEVKWAFKMLLILIINK